MWAMSKRPKESNVGWGTTRITYTLEQVKELAEAYKYLGSSCIKALQCLPSGMEHEAAIHCLERIEAVDRFQISSKLSPDERAEIEVILSGFRVAYEQRLKLAQDRPNDTFDTIHQTTP